MMNYALTILFASVAAAANNTTEAPAQQRQGWTSEPNCGTGTASIIWQCLTTIGLCVYVAVHLSVPPRPLSTSMAFLRKTLIVLTGLVVPEMWAFTALVDLTIARQFVKRSSGLNRFMTLKQAFFISSGGIAIRGLHAAVPSLKPVNHHNEPVTRHSGSVYVRAWDLRDVYDLSEEEVIFFADNVPSDEEISDKSKQDGLAKTITSMQAIWTIVQIAARGQQGLIISLLQVATLGFIAMAAFSYACWWSKPYDVSMPHVVEGDLAVKDGKPQIDTGAWKCIEFENSAPAWVIRLLPASLLARLPQLRLMKRAYTEDIANRPLPQTMTSFGVFTIAFAALHCLGWNYSFPTLVEAWLWRASNLATMGFGLSIVLMSEAPRVGRVFGRVWSDDEDLPMLATRILGILYLVGRFYLMVECFIAFRDAPSSMYQQVDWSAYFPHFGA